MAKTSKKTPASVLPDGAGHSSFIRLGGQDFELILTTRATREIASRYGGLEELGEKLENETDLGEQIGEIAWLIALLANQSVLIHNLTHPDSTKPEVTAEMVELLTVPGELAGYREAITAALAAGTRREVASPKA
ncbi:hypothetical protein [Trueperella pyogenes]|uniref:hypothetical protein n=1 Tax=Trueperella pyogenes TaxID=1661 RepID=UPI00345DB787